MSSILNYIYIGYQFTSKQGLSSIITIFLICLFILLNPKRTKIHLYNNFKIFALFLFIILIILFIQKSLINGYHLTTSTASAIFFITVPLLVVRNNFFIAKNLVIFFTLLNFCLTLSFFVEDISKLFWREFLGFLRFRSYYSEPSYASISYLINIILLYSKNKNLCKYIFINIFLIFFTFSISGLFILSLLSMFYLIQKKSFKILLPIFFICFLLTILSFSNNFLYLIYDRIDRIISGDDLSAMIRIFNPIYALSVLSTNQLYLFFGVGISDVNKYLLDNKSSYIFLYNWDVVFQPYLNNSFVNIIFNFGLFFYLVFLSCIIYYTIMLRNYFNLIFFILFCFASGFVFNPFFSFILILCFRKNNNYYVCTQYLRQK